jgi:hypothetical protein
MAAIDEDKISQMQKMWRTKKDTDTLESLAKAAGVSESTFRRYVPSSKVGKRAHVGGLTKISRDYDKRSKARGY